MDAAGVSVDEIGHFVSLDGSDSEASIMMVLPLAKKLHVALGRAIKFDDKRREVLKLSPG